MFFSLICTSTSSGFVVVVVKDWRMHANISFHFSREARVTFVVPTSFDGLQTKKITILPFSLFRMETNTTTTTTRRHTATAMGTAREGGDDDADVFIVDVSSWVPIRRENDDDDTEYQRDVNRTASCPHSNQETTTTTTTTSRTDRRARAMEEHRSGGFAHPLGGRRGSSARTEEEASKPRRWRRGKRAAQPPQSASSESGVFNWTTTTTRNDDGGIKMITSSNRSFSFGDENDNHHPMGAVFAAARTVGCTKHLPSDRTVGARMFIHAARRRIDALRAARGATVPSSALDVPRLGGSRCTKYDAYR